MLSVRPGITDPASIAYRDENAYIEEVMPAKLRHAVRYVETRLLATDLRMISATVRSVWLP